MGDRNYYPNQYNPFLAQNYDRRQPQRQSLSSYFDMRSPRGEGFSVNTSTPVYNSGASYDQAQNSSALHDQSGETFHDDEAPPSYEESQSDMLLSRSNTNNRYSPARNDKGEGKLYSQKRSFSDFFDIPGQTEPLKRSPEWSRDNFNPSQSYQRDSQRRLSPYPNYSQQPSTTFSSDYGAFRGRGNRQNRGRSMGSGSWQGQDRVGGHNNKRNYIGGRNRDKEKTGFTEKERGIEDEGDEEDEYGGGQDHGNSVKVNVFVPDPSIVTKHKYYPPSPEEMGEMFKDLVIYFFFKIPRNKKEQNPFVVICESFRRSEGYADLDVEDGYDVTFKDRKFCTLRYRGMMMVRGVGENNNLKEPRVLAGVELINKLAMSCYTLEAKPEYFNANSFTKMQEQGDVPGLYCFVPWQDASDYDAACKYLQSIFSKEDSDVEYMFHFPDHNEALKLKSWANKHELGLDARVIKNEWIGICRHRTPQYWRDKILASGTMENHKFLLKSPRGIGNLLIENFDIKEAVVQLKTRPLQTKCTLQNVYGPQGFGPNISIAIAPWRRRGGNTRNKKGQQKQRKIIQLVKQGVPLTQAKGFNYLNKRKQKKLKQKLGQ